MKIVQMLGLAIGVFSCSFAAAATVDVAVGPGGAFVFGPEAVEIEVGDTIRWTWGSSGHNVGSGVPGDPTPAFLSGPPAKAGTVFEVIFDQAFLDANPVDDNLYDYHCHPHGGFGMVGTVQVILKCTADISGDSTVDSIDLLALLGAWGPCPEGTDTGSCVGDLNDDDMVDVIDLLALLGAWGTCP